MSSTRIVNTYLKRQLNVGPILNLSTEPIGTNTQQFFQAKFQGEIPFKKNSFDFIFCKEPQLLFTNPYHMYSELLRLGNRGMIQTQSPISVLLEGNGPNSQMVSWTDTYSNTLCFMPYYFPLDYLNLEINKWQILALNKPTLLHDWYIWNSKEELNIKLIHPEDTLDYEIMFQSALEETFRNTVGNQISY